MPALSTEAIDALPVACKDARSNHIAARRTVGRWENYLLVAGALLLILLLAAAGFTLAGASAGAIVTMVASIADGVALAWIVSRRADAEKRLRYWYGKVHANCPAEAVEEQEAIGEVIPLRLGN